MSARDGKPRICLSWGKKNDMHPIEMIDAARGDLSRSEAIQRILRYSTNYGQQTLKNILDSDHKQTIAA